MPLSDFAGRRNWGYDGVVPYAPDSSYGRPEDLKALVQAAHHAGLMVFLDVVYNHFGPKGNYLSLYAPQFFTDRHHTPWGAAINFAADPVRQYFIHNALYWLEEYHFDGLRFDAVHAIIDESPRHILEDIAAAVRARDPDRHVHLVLENDANQARFLGAGRYDAQWNDDSHHAYHVLATGESRRLLRRVRRRARQAPRALPRRGLRLSGGALALQRASRAASPAATCRRRLSSTSCRTTTRSATARTASASPRSPTRAS